MLMVAEPRSRRVGDGGAPPALRAARIVDAGGSPFRRDQLVEVQRARILAGAMQVVGEHGASNVAIAEIVQRAGVSRRTFYELFADRSECLAATFDDALEVAATRLLPAITDQRGWLAQLRAGVGSLMRFLDEQPQLGRLLVCDSLSGGRELSEWRGRVVAQLVAFVDEGRQQSAQSERVPSMQADGSVGGVLAILQNLFAGGEPVCFTELSPSLVAMIVMPYLGAAAAKRELERPVPAVPVPVSSRSQHLPVLPFKEAGMRLTYRTMRVLLAIAEHPGASNRQIGDLAEISDQGQMSKLLRRLQHADLVSNDGVAPGQGGPNVWQLTATGQRLADSVRAYSDTPGEEKDTGAHGASRRGAAPVGLKGGSHNSRRTK